MTDQQQIEKAAQIMHDMNGCADPYGTCISTSEYYREMAQALADAGMLADCHQTQRAVKGCDRECEARRDWDALVAERDEARATNRRLNRRLQIQEAAINELVTGSGRGKSRPVVQEIWQRCQESHDRYHDHTTGLILRLRAERDALAATVRRVRELHSADPGWDCCKTCGYRELWPCPTASALDDLREQP